MASTTCPRRELEVWYATDTDTNPTSSILPLYSQHAQAPRNKLFGIGSSYDKPPPYATATATATVSATAAAIASSEDHAVSIPRDHHHHHHHQCRGIAVVNQTICNLFKLATPTTTSTTAPTLHQYYDNPVTGKREVQGVGWKWHSSLESCYVDVTDEAPFGKQGPGIGVLQYMPASEIDARRICKERVARARRIRKWVPWLSFSFGLSCVVVVLLITVGYGGW